MLTHKKNAFGGFLSSEDDYQNPETMALLDKKSSIIGISHCSLNIMLVCVVPGNTASLILERGAISNSNKIITAFRKGGGENTTI
ncbi:hypothetical protein [Chitinophaga flava]|uniref:Uncharacterized protein n=1 Tax=Chitinophaga flava TaxID=2259036 RepID=A0A365XPR4_9BACT|nr:hypothetical protein [Chitinophaga flava]RBL88108.1 hypothetical protein DF182_31800 [Chitinophaga flava]